MLNTASHDRLTEQAHQVVGQHGDCQCCFSGPEGTHVEGVESKIGFEFLDPVFSISPAAIQSPYFYGWQLKRGCIGTVASSLNGWIVCKQLEFFSGSVFG